MNVLSLNIHGALVLELIAQAFVIRLLGVLLVFADYYYYFLFYVYDDLIVLWVLLLLALLSSIDVDKIPLVFCN